MCTSTSWEHIGGCCGGDNGNMLVHWVYWVHLHRNGFPDIRIVDPAQKFRDPSTETQLANWESAGVTKTLNKAWDKQLLREQHFDILNQLPKKGHIHEVPYKQRLKPPSLITANHVRYNILSTLGEDVHHWAPPGRRPPRIPTPPKKEAEVTKVNKPREYDILTNKVMPDASFMCLPLVIQVPFPVLSTLCIGGKFRVGVY